MFEVICSWCGAVIGLGEVEHSHGICDWCRADQFGGEKPEGGKLTLWVTDRQGPMVYQGVTKLNVGEWTTIYFAPDHHIQAPTSKILRLEVENKWPRHVGTR